MTTQTPDQQQLVASQFGPRADAYVTSAVHAQGEDLQRIAGWAAARKPARALDLGCGGGHVAFALAPHAGEVVAYDLSPDMLTAVSATAKSKGLANIATQQGAVESLPFPDASFDMVVSRYSAHHWRGFDAALTEARRVLKPGGVAAFADIFAPEDKLCDTWMQSIELLRDPSHQRDYSRAEWRAALERAGFKPGHPFEHRLRLEFTSWLSRMATPPVQAEAIRALFAQAPAEVRSYLAIEADNSFSIDSMVMEAWPA
jgi:SAM-dependent methyltransferase